MTHLFWDECLIAKHVMQKNYSDDNPRRKNCVPMVATKEGIPMATTKLPFRSPEIIPADSAPSVAKPTFPVSSNIVTKATIPMAMIDGKERSISPAMMTIVRGRAMMAKNGVVAINA